MHLIHFFYQGNELLLLPVLSLLLFFGIFVSASVRAWRANAPARVTALMDLPLADDTAPHACSGESHE